MLEGKDIVEPPNEIQDFDFEFFMLVNTMRCNPLEFAQQIMDPYIKKCFSGLNHRPYKGRGGPTTEGATPLMKMSDHLKAIAEMPSLKWNTRLEDAVEEYYDLTEEEKAWELPDRLESCGVS